MSFRLVPNSVTLDDLKRHNSPNRRVISPNSVAFEEDYVKVLEDTPTLFAAECRPKNLVLAMYHLWRYCQGITPSENVYVRHSAVASEKLTNNQP